MHLEPLEQLFPMRLFGGKGLRRRRLDGALYDFGDRLGPARLARSTPRYGKLQSTSSSFDGRLPGTVWHRLLLDGLHPAEASVTVDSRAADDARELARLPWRPEPPLVYRRGDGSELPFAAPEPTRKHGTWELLFQRARGRYLQLRLRLTGDGRTSPRLRALRAYYPRFSYLERYLPKVYREDPESASFLDRFLANIEGIHTEIEDRIAAAQVLFDARSAAGRRALDWLLGWFDVDGRSDVARPRRRLFLRHAMEFFALRGTIPGIQLALRLALDPCDDDDCSARDDESSDVADRRALPHPPDAGGRPRRSDRARRAEDRRTGRRAGIRPKAATSFTTAGAR